MPSRILVIEDNPNNRELLTYLLSAFGHTVLAAEDGRQGLEVAAAEFPDLILCDMQMPKLDGFGIVAQLRNNPALSRVSIIAVTADAMVGDRERMIAAGFDGYISKPIDPTVFVPQVEAFLKPPPDSGGPWP